MPLSREEKAERTVLDLDSALYQEARRCRLTVIASKYGHHLPGLSNNLNLNQPDRRATLSQFEDICTEAVATGGGDMLRDSLGRLLGCAWLPLPSVSGKASPALLQEISELVRSVGDMSGDVTQALADGRVDPDELDVLEKDLMRLYQAGLTVVESARAYREGE